MKRRAFWVLPVVAIAAFVFLGQLLKTIGHYARIQSKDGEIAWSSPIWYLTD